MIVAPLAGLLLSATLPAAREADTGFAPCADALQFAALKDSQCTRIAVPLDRSPGADPEQAELFVRRFPAIGERRGTVWLIAGGPGESGASFYPLLDTFQRAFSGYDLIIPDHRGTGYSSRICPDQEAVESEDGAGLAGSEWGPCIGHTYAYPARTQAFSITNAAHDLSTLIARYRDPGEVHVYGVSYGTQLVLRMMQVAPPALDGILLDSLVPTDDDTGRDLSQRTAVVDAVGRAVLGPGDLAAYERLLADAPDAAWRARIPGGDLKSFMGMLLDFPTVRRQMPALIEDLSRGGTGRLDAIVEELERVTDGMAAYPQSPASLPLVMQISGSENNRRPDLTEQTVAAESQAALFTSPLAGFLVGNPLAGYPRDPFWNGTPQALPPTLVIHGSLDPKTPYAGAEAHVARLADSGPVRLVPVSGAPHFIAFAAPDCFVRIVGAAMQNAQPVDRCTLDEP
ncbi:MAG: alpha/beta hydrolase [Brevundimonas sp.]|uniref:alpha/beta hydrolase n=1 Tax=Brevundimonas sp. TaxID=1871086 RepID=UPI002733B4FB|nr:alpha/beta hydrolase [Brevundimonas sp.]MDP3406112.1 alpha/beta hydrolase [Brevundimonas sp.]